jgi:hypothetical protein
MVLRLSQLCKNKDFHCADLRIFIVQISDFLLCRFQDFGDIPNPAEQFGCGTLTGNSTFYPLMNVALGMFILYLAA